MTKTKTAPRPRHSFGKLGDQLAGQFGRAKVALRLATSVAKLEEVARQTGADLTDPEQFRIVQELAA